MGLSNHSGSPTIGGTATLPSGIQDQMGWYIYRRLFFNHHHINFNLRFLWLIGFEIVKCHRSSGSDYTEHLFSALLNMLVHVYLSNCWYTGYTNGCWNQLNSHQLVVRPTSSYIPTCSYLSTSSYTKTSTNDCYVNICQTVVIPTYNQPVGYIIPT